MNEHLGAVLAAVNATLNGTSALLIALGWAMIRQGRRQAHKRFMISAFITSTVFLASYLTRMALTGTHLYPGHGALKAVYYTILFSHMTLAGVTPFLVVGAIYFGLKGRFAEHKNVVRWTLPIWLYVSVTGVLVYLLLYHGSSGTQAVTVLDEEARSRRRMRWLLRAYLVIVPAVVAYLLARWRGVFP